jgi:hypothetical protein
VKSFAGSEEEDRPSKKAKKEGAEGKEAEGETAEDPIEVDTPPNEDIATPAEPANGDTSAGKTGTGTEAKSGNGAKDETIPGDEAHLDHPENWATGKLSPTCTTSATNAGIWAIADNL